MKHTSIILAFALLASIASAEISVSTGVKSKYVSNSSVFYDKPVAQTSVSGDFGKGFSWNVFNVLDLRNPSSRTSYGNETDYTVSYEKEFGTDGVYSAGADLSYWDCIPPADVIVSTVWVSRKLGDQMDVKLTYDRLVTTKRSFMEGGTYVKLGFNKYIPLGELVTFVISPSIIRDDGAFGTEPAWLARIDSSLQWKLGKVSVSAPTLNIHQKITKTRDERKNVAVLGFEVGYTF